MSMVTESNTGPRAAEDDRDVRRHPATTPVRDPDDGDAPPSRRARVRNATVAEIRRIARRLLVEQGAAGVTLRAIAREMGMTAPGLYRYFGSLDDLLSALRRDCVAELTATVESAVRQAGDDDLDGQVCAALRAFRSWGKRSPAEFTLLFGPPAGPTGAHRPEEPDVGDGFGAVFLDLFLRVWVDRRFTPPPEDTIPLDLHERLRGFADSLGPRSHTVPIGAVWVLASVWVRIYGLVCMEIFGRLRHLVMDMEPFFEAELRETCRTVGVRYRPPRPPAASSTRGSH